MAYAGGRVSSAEAKSQGEGEGLLRTRAGADVPDLLRMRAMRAMALYAFM